MFLPTIQFSLTPWKEAYSQQVLENSKKMARLREKFALPILLDLQSDKSKMATLEYGFPATPSWWVEDGLGMTTNSFEDQYLVGTDLLVVPILDRGVRLRDVHFPKGYEWARIDLDIAEVTEDKFSGTVRDFPIGLYEIGLFYRVK